MNPVKHFHCKFHQLKNHGSEGEKKSDTDGNTEDRQK